jgi:hypothetical protein
MPVRHHFVPHARRVLDEGPVSVNGRADHSAEPPAGRSVDLQHLDRLPDDDLEAELTIAAYAPGRVRWELYERLLRERLRRRLIAA